MQNGLHDFNASEKIGIVFAFTATVQIRDIAYWIRDLAFGCIEKIDMAWFQDTNSFNPKVMPSEPSTHANFANPRFRKFRQSALT